MSVRLVAVVTALGLAAACAGSEDGGARPESTEVRTSIVANAAPTPTATSTRPSETTSPDDTSPDDTSPDDTSPDDTPPVTTAPPRPVEPATAAGADAGVVITVFTTADGLLTDRIGTVDVGVDGTVWVSTEGQPAWGVPVGPRLQTFAWYDGERFVDVGAPDRSILDAPDAVDPDSGVYGMDVSGGPDGTLWIATTGFDSVGDVYHFDGRQWSSPVEPPASLVRGVATPDGSMWAVSMTGVGIDDDIAAIPMTLARVDADGIDAVIPPPPGGIRCAFCIEFDVDVDGTLWVRTENGTYRFDGDAWVSNGWTTVAESPDADDPGVVGGSRWSLGADGSHWYLTTEGRGDAGLTRVNDQGSAGLVADGRAPMDATCLAAWNGVEPGELTEQMLAETAINGWNTRVAGAADGRAWVALRCSGVYRIDVDDPSNQVVHYGLADGLPSLEVRDLAAHPDGSIWVATDAGLVRITPDD